MTDLTNKRPETEARRPRFWLVAAPLLAHLLTGCGPPQDAMIEPSPRLDAMPPPELQPTSSFGTLLDQPAADAETILTDAEIVRARAAALRQRAARLSAEPTSE